MSYTARRQALSLETQTHAHPLFSSVSFSFDTAGGDVIFFTPMGVVEKTTTPAQTEHPLKATKQGLESMSRARVEYSYPQRFPSRQRGNERPTEAIGEQGT